MTQKRDKKKKDKEINKMVSVKYHLVAYFFLSSEVANSRDMF